MRLRVNIHGHFHRAVPQQFLHYLDIFPVRLQKRRVGAPEGVPGNPLVDAESLDMSAGAKIGHSAPRKRSIAAE